MSTVAEVKRAPFLPLSAIFRDAARCLHCIPLIKLLLYLPVGLIYNVYGDTYDRILRRTI